MKMIFSSLLLVSGLLFFCGSSSLAMDSSDQNAIVIPQEKSFLSFLKTLPKELTYAILSKVIELSVNADFKKIKEIEIEDPSQERRSVLDHMVSSIACSKDGKLLFIQTGFTKNLLWDATSYSCTKRLPTGYYPSSLSSQFDTFFTAGKVAEKDAEDIRRDFIEGFRTTGFLYSFSKEECEERELKGHTEKILSVAFSRDGTKILTGSKDTTARLWDSTTGKSLCEFKGHTGAVFAVAFSPDEATIVTGSEDTTACLWNAATEKSLAEFKGHTEAVITAAFSPQGTIVATGSADATVRLWNSEKAVFIRELQKGFSAIKSLGFNLEGTILFSCSGEDPYVYLWDVKTGDLKQVIEVLSQDRVVSYVTWGSDGKSLIGATYYPYSIESKVKAKIVLWALLLSKEGWYNKKVRSLFLDLYPLLSHYTAHK